VINQNLMIFPYSGEPFAQRFFGYEVQVARTSPDGTAVLVYSNIETPGLPARRLALINAEGRVIAVLDRDVAPADFGVSSDNRNVVFAGKDITTGQTGVFVGMLGTSHIELAVPLSNETAAATSVSWLAGGSAILFSRDGKVQTYDVGSRQVSMHLRAGADPTCSPDGRWIAYRGPNGTAILAAREGAETKRASRGRIYGRVHWSPDSAYYFVHEQVRGSSWDKCPFEACFVVYRVNDGSRFELQGTGRKDSSFGWLRGTWTAK
jgi:hypothetical protein